MDSTTWPLTTPRLSLRPMEPDDLDPIWTYRGMPEVQTWLGGSTDEQACRRRFLEPTEGLQQLVVELEGRLVGDLMLVVESAWSQAEVVAQAKDTQGVLGWVFHPDATGRGLATEAVSELIRYAFETLGLRRVVAVCFADNEPSWRLMERLGMRREAHHAKDSLHRDRGWLDEYVYALLADEWRR